jgi:vesicle coat complex subunit
MVNLPYMPDSYFIDARKGEVNELRTLLKTFSVEKSTARKRDIIKKVIAYMTLGIDVSRLFTEMMLAIESRDLVIKKMVYLYMTTYATSNPTLAQMCTNSLCKDCSHDDPMVRGLALRSLCSLRLPDMVEYMREPIRRALLDQHAYVRKTGVFGVLKLIHLEKSMNTITAVNYELHKTTLTSMLKDPDPMVVTNAISVLNEICIEDGGMVVTRPVMLHLLNRLGTFTEFGLTEVLALLARYKPVDTNEVFQIMNLLDPVLRTSNSGSVLATIKCFFYLTKDIEGVRKQVYERIKPPLLTLIAGGIPELIYILLKHVNFLVNEEPGCFDDEYRQFYVRYNDPSHIKYMKVQILPKLANETNALDLLWELGEYVSDVDTRLGKMAIASIGVIACTERCCGSPVAESVVEKLVELCSLDVGHVSSAAACTLRDVLRKHNNQRSIVSPVLCGCLKFIDDGEGKAAIIWMLGEVGDVVTESPYVLEKVVDAWEEQPTVVKLALLTTCMRLFFKRPGEMQKILGKALSSGVGDVGDQDLHDRALYYYRLLQSGASNAESIVSGVSPAIEIGKDFAEDDEREVRMGLNSEFNSLSICYGKTSEHFVGEAYRVGKGGGGASSSDGGMTIVADGVGALDMGAQQQQEAAAAADSDGSAAYNDLLGFVDSSPLEAAAAAAMMTGSAAAAPALEFNSGVSVDGQRFQSLWGQLSESVNTMIPMGMTVVQSTDTVEAACGGRNILTMASGEMENEFKFFLYAQEKESGGLFLIQAVVDKTCQPQLLTVLIKTDVQGGRGSVLSEEVLGVLKGCMNVV